MTTALLFAIVFAMLMLVVAVVNKLKCRRLLGELDGMKAKMANYVEEKKQLVDEIISLSEKGGIGEVCLLSVIGELSRVENNLYRMGEVDGRKQAMRACERMKDKLQTEGYTVAPLLGMEYLDGMQLSAVFIEDKSVEPGKSIIISVQRPQVNRAGRMIQAGKVTVGQNL